MKRVQLLKASSMKEGEGLIIVNDKGVIEKFSGTGEYLGGSISGLLVAFADALARASKEDGATDTDAAYVIKEATATTLLTALMSARDEVSIAGMFAGIGQIGQCIGTDLNELMTDIMPEDGKKGTTS